MSLVIASNQDNEYVRDAQSLFTPWSFRNALSSTYKIPANSQVCLQSAKVNLDGRSTVEQNNSVYYDWFGVELDSSNTSAIDSSTSYPVKQQFVQVEGVAQLTTDELALAVKDNHREFHPNRMGLHDCIVSRTAGKDFNGYEFQYGFNACQTQNASVPTVIDAWSSGIVSSNGSFVWNPANGEFLRVENASTTIYPSVAILRDKPLSTSNGSYQVEISDANASGVPWGVGLSRDCPNYFVNSEGDEYDFKPEYFTFDDEIASAPMRLTGQQYYSDFSVHRNIDGEMVVRQSSWDKDKDKMVFSEIEYWTNASSGLVGTGGRYDIDTNGSGFDFVEFRVQGEKVSLYAGKGGAAALITQVDTTSAKNSMFKPINQCCWCLHPILFIGKKGTNTTNKLKISGYSGLDITDYNTRSRASKYMGWFERLTLGVQKGGIKTPEGVRHCRVVDSRVYNQPSDSTRHTYIGLNGSNVNAYKPAMICSPNDLYVPTFNSATARLFGFKGRSLVNTGAFSTSGSNDIVTFTSDEAPPATSKSIFVRLNGFGQQVMNARTGNKSTILSHLPTAEEKVGGLFFYEPNRDVWLDLNNPYEITISDISIDFVYSNEQYAKNLQGQSIVVLYFRTPTK